VWERERVRRSTRTRGSKEEHENEREEGGVLQQEGKKRCVGTRESKEEHKNERE
jgi:hypothetical protein